MAAHPPNRDKTLEDLKAKNGELRQELSGAKLEIDKLNRRIEELRMDRSQAEKEEQGIERARAESRVTIERIQREKNEALDAARAAKEREDKAKRELATALAKSNNALRESKEAREEAARAKAENQSSTDLIEQLKRERREALEKADLANRRLKEAQTAQKLAEQQRQQAEQRLTATIRQAEQARIAHVREIQALQSNLHEPTKPLSITAAVRGTRGPVLNFPHHPTITVYPAAPGVSPSPGGRSSLKTPKAAPIQTRVSAGPILPAARYTAMDRLSKILGKGRAKYPGNVTFEKGKGDANWQNFVTEMAEKIGKKERLYGSKDFDEIEKEYKGMGKKREAEHAEHAMGKIEMYRNWTIHPTANNQYELVKHVKGTTEPQATILRTHEGNIQIVSAKKTFNLRPSQPEYEAEQVALMMQFEQALEAAVRMGSHKIKLFHYDSAPEAAFTLQQWGAAHSPPLTVEFDEATQKAVDAIQSTGGFIPPKPK